MHQVTGPGSTPSTPPRDPASIARIRAAQQMISGYHIGEPPEDALLDESKLVHYCMSAAGVVEVRRNLIGYGTALAKRVAGLPEIPCGFRMSLPHIPWMMFAQTVVFFKKVIETNNNRSLEAIVQFYFNPDTQQYRIYIPPQKVGSGSVNHTGNGDPEGKEVHVADIHSHGSTMSAFFSGTDDGDESRHERLYGVIGNVSSRIPSMKFRARIGSNFVDLRLADMVEVGNIVVPISSVMGQSQALEVDPFADVEIPGEWLDQVTVETYAVSTYHGRGYNHADNYWTRPGMGYPGAGVPGRDFRPAWERDAHTSAHAAVEVPASTVDASVLISSSNGQCYMDTDKGVFPVEIQR